MYIITITLKDIKLGAEIAESNFRDSKSEAYSDLTTDSWVLSKDHFNVCIWHDPVWEWHEEMSACVLQTCAHVKDPTAVNLQTGTNE